MNAVLKEEFLNTLLDDLEQDRLVLPTLPEIALQVRDKVADEDASLADVSKVIKKDAALSARLIQVVNSPLLRSSNPIESIDIAVNRMGGNMIRNLVTSMVMEQMFQATSEITDKRLRQIWKHSTEVASMAMALASPYKHLKSDQAMLAGLTHDLGALPILSRAENYPELLSDATLLDEIVTDAHSQVGSAILSKWNFPPELIKVTEQHENLEYDSASGPDYVDLVIAANLQSYGGSTHHHAQADFNIVPAMSKLGLAEGIEVIEMSAVNDDIADTRNILAG